MSRIRRQIRQMMNEMDARAARLRPGSVLILVVVLLVLMALLGTAYLVTARNERVATKLYSHNVQIDLLVQGVENMALGAMSDTTWQSSDIQHYDDWFTTGQTPLVPPGAAAPANPAIDHSWLASRIPDTAAYLTANTASATGLLSGGIPLWPVPKGATVFTGGSYYISLQDNNTSAPGTAGQWGNMTGLVPTSGAALATTPFWAAVSGPLAPRAVNEDPRYPSPPAGYSTAPRPDGVRFFTTPTYQTIAGKNYPALQYYSLVTQQIETALAASATGNGIADSFLWRLPIGTVDGITYYAAVRIIDNNSAININTANSQLADFTGAGVSYSAFAGFFPGIFPASIGLNEMLAPFVLGTDSAAYDQLALGKVANTLVSETQSLDYYRFNNAYRPYGIVGDTGNTTPWDDTVSPPASRTDFKYITTGDAMFFGMTRRLNNPGIAWYNTASKTAMPFQTLSWGDAAALAYRGDLSNPNASPTMTEQLLPISTWNYARSTPWDPSQAGPQSNISTQYWFAQYIDPMLDLSLPASTHVNRRAFLTTQNPQSNLMPAHALTAGANGTTGLASLQFLSQMIPVNTASPTNNQSVNYANGLAPRVSLNTADVGLYDLNTNYGTKGPTLWFGFYNAMLDAINGPTINPNIRNIAQGAAQFRSPIRDINGSGIQNYTKATTYLTGPETLLLRSLLAAVNAKDLRDTGDNAEFAGIAGFPASQLGGSVNMYAYGTERQVFITEVYANTEMTAPQFIDPAGRANPNAGKKNPAGYVAVEIYNPYDYPVNLSWWTLMVVNRTGAKQTITVNPVTAFNGFSNTTGDSQNAIIGPRCYMVLENYPPGGTGGRAPATDAGYRPTLGYNGYPTTPFVTAGTNSGNSTTALNYYYVPNLTDVFQGNGKLGGELVIMRQCNAHGLPLAGLNNTNPANFVNGTYTPGTPTFNSALATMAPVDSFDFSGVNLSLDIKFSPLQAIHYVRMNPGNSKTAATISPTAWKFVYPGRWDVSYSPYRQEGIQHSNWTEPDNTAMPPVPPAPGQYDVWVDLASSTLGGTPLLLGNSTGAPTASYTNIFPPIQLNNTDFGGPNKLYSTPYQFPFGGFARVGDVLQVPFIGAYFICDPTNTTVYELNPVTRDAALADDNDSAAPKNDDAIEQIGRFCPLLATEQTASTTPETNVLIGTSAAYNPWDSYGWASHILDYFTAIQNPADDYLPNVDPVVYTDGPWNMSTLLYTNAPTPPATLGTFGSLARPIGQTINTGNGPNKGYEDLAPIHGLININTASWRTLAAIPWQAPSNSSAAAANSAMLQNEYIAQCIVWYRDLYGPYKSLLDLNKVPGTSNVANLQAFFGSPTGTLGPSAGNISPGPTASQTTGFSGITTDNVVNDFESRFATINRVSNLITTRSDTYTVYVLVQGWSGVGTPSPNLVVQRRAAIIVDRSQLTPNNPTLNVTQVQGN